MKKLLLGLLIGLVLGVTVGVGISAYSSHKTAQAVASEPTRAQLLTLVNAERAKHGAAPLKEDVRLDASAQMKAQDEQTYGYFGHVSPSTSPFAGKQGYLLINDTGIYCKTDSENLTTGTPNTAEAAVSAWIASTPHHKAMIDNTYTLTGFGISGDNIVEHFCQQ